MDDVMHSVYTPGVIVLNNLPLVLLPLFRTEHGVLKN